MGPTVGSSLVGDCWGCCLSFQSEAEEEEVETETKKLEVRRSWSEEAVEETAEAEK